MSEFTPIPTEYMVNHLHDRYTAALDDFHINGGAERDELATIRFRMFRQTYERLCQIRDRKRSVA